MFLWSSRPSHAHGRFRRFSPGRLRPGATDEQVLAVAFAQNRILLTEDSDFGDLVVRLRLPTHGVVRVALKSLAKADRAARLVKGLTELGHKVRGAMVTIEPNRTRVRPLPGSTDHGDKE